ncbi:SIR2 family NAD-dependent protein deacylase [Cellulomonas bogoriensis]|uniref:Uncharacterized protein n=1 Tax=Cellulomonas bogoriensis 69B4 = DSM 16987 TaxID=1386082 RepID=A0A0A0C2M7_9CELL|nr:SIR2 family protein [Cellulomonas bogoriensis]KGM14445.1 hypothetical protein N869_11040 [Cellulomonas bogoriensis 69B4 = DSM 16987]
MHRELGPALSEKVSEITSRTRRYALAHSLLATLGCTEVVTTNYDDLYERAAADAAHATVPVLPFDDPRPRTPWVLKMHGDRRDPASIVLTRSHMVGYDSRSRPLGSIVQALLLTRHLLVVGASMTDDNFLRLAHEVLAFRTSSGRGSDAAAPLGTVVTLTPNLAKQRLWTGRFDHLSATDEQNDGNPKARAGAAARLLAIFLDAVAMHAATARHLVDARYGYLLDGSDRAVAAASRELLTLLGTTGGDDRWAPLREALVALGGTPPATP